jgi:hypothetical protein
MSESIQVFQFPSWIGFTVILVGLGFIALAAWMKSNDSAWKKVLIFGFIGLLAAGGIGPGVLLDRVILTKTQVTQRTGFWFAPNVRTFVISEMASVNVELRSGRKGRNKEIWLITMKSGDQIDFDPSDLWDRHRVEIEEHLQTHGVEVS